MAKAKAIIPNKAGFIPVTIEVTLESRAELDWFGTIFNHTGVNSRLNGVAKGWCEPIADAASSLGADIHKVSSLSKAIPL